MSKIQCKLLQKNVKACLVHEELQGVPTGTLERDSKKQHTVS